MLRKSINQFKRLIHCKGCGTKFQTQSPGDWGFKESVTIKAKPSIREAHNEKQSRIYDNLTVEQKQALQFTPPEMEIEKYSSAQVVSAAKLKKKQAKFENFCRPCVDAQDGRSIPLLPSKYDTIGRLPRDARVMHVIDALDFPASIVSDLIDRPNTHYIVSRADLVLTHPNQISRLKEYVMDEVFNEVNVASSRVHVVSASKEWGLQSVLEALSHETYFVGKTNCGKSTLVAGLSGKPTKYWPLPFKTQFPHSHHFGDRKLVDTPSIPEQDNLTGIFSLLKPSQIRKITSGKMMLNKKNHYNIQPVVAKPGQVVSLGGLACIEVPKSNRGNATHVWAVHGVSGAMVNRTLSTVEKVPEINASEHPVHAGWSMTQKTQPLAHLFDADATKSLELVIRGLGPVFLKSYGKYTEPNIVKISALQGIEITQRQDILPWILHRKSKRSF